MRTKEWRPVPKYVLDDPNKHIYRSRQGWTLELVAHRHLWRVSGHWALRDPHERQVAQYDYYGSFKKNPPTTWANKIIKARQAV